MEHISNQLSRAFHWLHILLRLSPVTRFLALSLVTHFPALDKGYYVSPHVPVVPNFLATCHWATYTLPPLPLVKNFPALVTDYTVSRRLPLVHIYFPALVPVTHFPALIIGYHSLTGYTPFCDYHHIHITHTRI